MSLKNFSLETKQLSFDGLTDKLLAKNVNNSIQQ